MPCPRCGGQWNNQGPEGGDFPVDGFIPREEIRAAQRPGETVSLDGDDKRSSLAKQIVELTMASGVVLFHDQLEEPQASMTGDGCEIVKLRSKRFHRWLARLSWDKLRRVPGGEALNSALAVLEGKAVYDGPEIALHLRVASYNDAFWYDLGNGRAARITADGWAVEERPPILFRHHEHQQPQVRPVAGGDVRSVLKFLNVAPEDHLLLLAWLVSAIVPDIAHPIPDFRGGKGSGKSVGQSLLRRLLDPSRTERLSFPPTAGELAQQLAHHYAPVYDNIDSLPPWLSDVLCKAITGDGFTKRALYTDDDDVIYTYRRVVMLNGINVVAQRPDLLDRTLMMGLLRIPRAGRREEAELLREFEEACPRILGAMFDVLSRAIAVHPSVQVDGLERMADFTRWGAAISEVLGHGADAFLAAYRRNIGAQIEEAVRGHIVGAAIIELMKDQPEWRGSPTRLLRALEQAGLRARLLRSASTGQISTKGWPGAPYILTRRLNEVRSNLADLGIDIADTRYGEREIVITARPGESSQSSDGSVSSVMQDGQAEADTVATVATDATFQPSSSDEWEETIA